MLGGWFKIQRYELNIFSSLSEMEMCGYDHVGGLVLGTVMFF